MVYVHIIVLCGVCTSFHFIVDVINCYFSQVFASHCLDCDF